MWNHTRERAYLSGEPERLAEKLLDYVLYQRAFVVDGEVVYAPDEFDPEQVVIAAAPDGEVLARVPPHPDEP